MKKFAESKKGIIFDLSKSNDMTNEIQKAVYFVKTSNVHKIANLLMLNINDRAETVCEIAKKIEGSAFGLKIVKDVNPSNISRKQAYCIAYAIVENLNQFCEKANEYETECLSA